MEGKVGVLLSLRLLGSNPDSLNYYMDKSFFTSVPQFIYV